MQLLTPSLDPGDAAAQLSAYIATNIDVASFKNSLQRLQRRFDLYSTTCPAAFIAPHLSVTAEIRIQSELYLPIAEITCIFDHLYSRTLRYPPIFTSTPFHNSFSWADTFVRLPHNFQFSANPAALLENLLDNRDLMTEFLCASFLPRRFYGGLERYPGQQQCIRRWLATRKKGLIRCLDAACGTGEQTYGLVRLLSEYGFPPERIRLDGWTLEPLEVWAATYLRFPHDHAYQLHLRNETAMLFQRGYQYRISFACHDILNVLSVTTASGENTNFDLILCNGLLGGPIIHNEAEIDRVVGNLVRLLNPGGILLAADNFHDGWKQKCPQKALRASFEKIGLVTDVNREGIIGLKPD